MEVKDIARNEDIAGMITSGVEAQASALAIIRSAALQFADLIPRDYESNDVPAIVKHGRSLYADEFNGDHNLSAYFGDVATLSMAGNMPISYVDRKKEEQHTTGIGAVGLAKHDLKSAAKAAREEMGIARAAGGGRTPRQPTGPAEQVFSLAEFKRQLAGLFGNSKNPVKVLNDTLAEYHCEVTPIEKRGRKKAA
jgi:hypothetical protein